LRYDAWTTVWIWTKSPTLKLVGIATHTAIGPRGDSTVSAPDGLTDRTRPTTSA